MSVQAVAAAAFLIFNSKKKRKRKLWRKSLFNDSNISQQDLFLKVVASGQFENFTRMSRSDFEYLLMKISPYIRKQDTNFRDSVPPEVKLYCMLRFLASGDSYASLMYLFRVSKSAISIFIPEVCTAIIQVLKEYIEVRMR